MGPLLALGLGFSGPWAGHFCHCWGKSALARVFVPPELDLESLVEQPRHSLAFKSPSGGSLWPVQLLDGWEWGKSPTKTHMVREFRKQNGGSEVCQMDNSSTATPTFHFPHNSLRKVFIFKCIRLLFCLNPSNGFPLPLEDSLNHRPPILDALVENLRMVTRESMGSTPKSGS